MFSGFTNQISGWMATKTGAAGHPHEEVDPNAEPHQQQPEQYLPENGAAEMMGDEVGAENVAPQTGGGVSGFAKGLMQKGLSIKEHEGEGLSDDAAKPVGHRQQPDGRHFEPDARKKGRGSAHTA